MGFFKKRKKYILVTLGVFIVNYGLDRVTKLFALEYLSGKDSIVLLNNLMILIFAQNTGAFLSLGANWNVYLKYLVLLIIPILICIYGLGYLMFKEKKMYCIILISCIIGGGIGNLFDRLFNGFKVIDFLNFGIGNLRTGILNVADLSVTFGIILLLFFELRNDKIEKKKGEVTLKTNLVYSDALFPIKPLALVLEDQHKGPDGDKGPADDGFYRKGLLQDDEGQDHADDHADFIQGDHLGGLPNLQGPIVAQPGQARGDPRKDQKEPVF